jgi:hypothetical protein
MTSTREDVVITSSYLEGNEPFRSERYHVQGIECKREHGEFNYCHGLQEVWWPAEKTIINIEQDMECSDELIDGLLSCPHPLCAYAYLVYPTQLHRYIYCATSRQVDHNNPAKSNVYWLNKGEEWAVWSSIGFCKIDPIARVKPLDRLYWQWLEHSVNRIVGTYQHAGGAGFEWHIHWPEVEHYHDYKRIPDHLW